MREIKQISYNKSNRNGVKIRYIVIHDTGNPSACANAIAHYNYFNGGNRSSSADFFIDDMGPLCVNDYRKYYTWHVGDGRGKYGISNANSIGVELCINSDGNRTKAMKHMVKLVRELMDELNIPIDRVVRHYDASRKNCPQSMNKNGWGEWYEFKKSLQNQEELTVTQYEELKKSIDALSDNVQKLANPMIYDYMDSNMPEYAKPTIQKLMDKGYLKGDASGRLGLDESMIRIMVILDRSGAFDK